MDMDRVLREEIERLWDRLDVLAPVLLRPRRSWLSRLASLFFTTVS